jgi:hypothetical protein
MLHGICQDNSECPQAKHVSSIFYKFFVFRNNAMMCRSKIMADTMIYILLHLLEEIVCRFFTSIKISIL